MLLKEIVSPIIVTNSDFYFEFGITNVGFNDLPLINKFHFNFHGLIVGQQVTGKSRKLIIKNGKIKVWGYGYPDCGKSLVEVIDKAALKRDLFIVKQYFKNRIYKLFYTNTGNEHIELITPDKIPRIDDLIKNKIHANLIKQAFVKYFYQF